MRKCLPLGVLLALVLVFLAGCGGDQAPPPQPPIARFVTVGYDGGIWWSDSISSDTTPWNDVSRSGGSFFGLAYGGGRLVTVGSNHTCWSTDGSDWADASTGVTWGLGGVAYGNGVFVAVGGAGHVSTSTDGDSWAEITPLATGDDYLMAIAFGNGYFVAVGGKGQIWRSSDGTTWQQVVAPIVGRNDLNSVTYGNGLFVAVGASGQFKISADDGATWPAEREYNLSIYELTDVAYLNGGFVVVGVTGRIYVSNASTIADASEWDDHSFVTSNNFFGVTYGNGYYVAVGSSRAMMRSTDGAYWVPMPPMTMSTIPVGATLRDVIYLP